MNILVTGGASGIGGAITERLAADAANTVHFTFRSSTDAAQALATRFGNVRPIPCDFREPADVNALVDALDGFRLDALVNNALPTFDRSHFHTGDPREFESSFHDNVLPVVAITQRAIALFRKARRGRIVTILSTALLGVPPAGMARYVAEKAYIASLAKSWAAENAALGITSNCISPSMVRTRLSDRFEPSEVERAADAKPLHRLLTAEEVADSVDFLLHASDYINGVNLVMNAATDIV